MFDLQIRRTRWYVLLGFITLLAGAYLVVGLVFAGTAGAAPASPRLVAQGQDSPLVCPPNYDIVRTEGAAPVPGTDLVTGSQCDDCTFPINLPFAYSVYGQSFTSVVASSNGQLDFGPTADAGFAISCLPDTRTSYAIFAYWLDLNMIQSANCTGCGVYTSVSGSAPNRTFNIEYRAVTFSGGNSVNFTVILYEGQDHFDVVYTTPTTLTATIGAEQDSDGNVFVQYSCPGNPPSLNSGSKLAFTLATPSSCPSRTPTNTRVATDTRLPTNTRVVTPTVTGTPPTPIPVPTCGPGSNYSIASSTGASLVAGTDLVPGSRCDDCLADVTLPFTYNLYGTPYGSAKVGSDGYMLFTGATLSFVNSCLPYANFNNALMPYWDDLRTDCAGCGIYTSVSGSAPNRILNIEWRASTFNPSGGSANFEVRLYEGQDRFDFVYASVINGGNSATAGVQRNTNQYTQHSCNSSALSSGLQLAFTEESCPPARRDLSAHVVWSGRPAQPTSLQALPIKLTLRPIDGGEITDYPVQNTDASGNFTVSVDNLPDGTYLWWAKGSQFLANAGTVDLTGATVTQLDLGSMPSGDANGDNAVTASDFILLKGYFARGCGGLNFDNRPDFNGDCRVDVNDFILLKNNFGASGAVPLEQRR
ncbi:MAG: dockerin type I repeat-containing protein [Chloroflexia bacterium]